MISEETKKFLRHWLLLLGAAGVWFVWEKKKKKIRGRNVAALIAS